MRRLLFVAFGLAALAVSAPRRLVAQQQKSTNPDSVLQALQQAGSSTAPAATAHVGAYSFANLHWGATKAETRARLADAGFRFLKQDKDGDLTFSGRVLEQPTDVYALFAGARLVHVLVVLNTDGDRARSVYDRMREALLQKYGAPRATVEQFTEPYESGDGHEQDALRAGKAQIATFWVNDVAGRQETLSLMIGNDLTVSVGYESPEWDAEEKARAAKSTKVF